MLPELATEMNPDRGLNIFVHWLCPQWVGLLVCPVVSTVGLTSAHAEVSSVAPSQAHPAISALTFPQAHPEVNAMTLTQA